jgi:hypothetical protein
MALDRLADAMARTRTLRDIIGPKELARIIFEWMWLTRSQPDQPALVDQLLREVDSRIQELTVWLPIHELAIEQDFRLGGVALRTMTREMIGAYCDRMIAGAPPDKLRATEARAVTVRKRLQGGAAAVVTVRAEVARAVEVAVTRSTGALTILRFWSPAALVPQARSYLTLLGAENIAQRTYFTTSGEQIVSYSEATVEEYVEFGQALSSSKIADLLTGFRHFDRLFSLEEPNEFQETARSVLEIFGRGTLYRNITEKLIHMLVALESLLLRNESEPIQDNLGWRIAYAHQASADERLQKLAIIRAAYSIRSKFLHHGVDVRPEPDDLDLLTKFMRVAWMFLFELPRFAFGFESKVAFLDMLDRRRAGG